jgi:hypothetical protein
MTMQVKISVLAAMSVVAMMNSVAAAPIWPTSPAMQVTPIPVKCIGNHRNYVGFNHCMRLNPRDLRYCNRICGTGS